MDAAEIAAIDAASIWHPYGSARPGTPPIVVDSAAGTRLHLADGRSVVDGMSSWWAAIHGYAHPVLDDAVREQLGSMAHVMFGGLTHEPAARLAAALVEMTPDPLRRVFFSDSGSVGVEVAAKMALQYWRGQGVRGRTRLLTWRGGYHGDTVTPMSVCDPDGGMHAQWTGVLPDQVFVPAPPRVRDADYVAGVEETLARHADEVAAVIVEPVVQGAGGMRFHDPELLVDLRRICDAHGVLLIFDEIATGFGRTGELFAADHAGVSPDILCLGKALTGGYMTMAATLCTDHVAQVISDGEMGVLAHGPTFMANPLACAVSSASLSLIATGRWRAQVAGIAEHLRVGLEDLRDLPQVADVRVLGAIGVVQLTRPVDMARATDAAVGAGAWLRPFRDLVYTMPPYISSPHDLDTIVAGVRAVVAAHGDGPGAHDRV
ncbi:adenosylmethionine--8-amino-7-oxononanoate transaminase [Williamsia deligens]|uniref:Adenosylmethionine-8-amino-7-oxononanoate aminotransferase n=1 Tax=Williamsia deligens TaxID=321325 RepID=A0ABW3G971_9NOCA|nr:adenosylmethionine--8-amino-7-oxononanoate transaminase [Williamsia deligens]